jgi:hypothetical protein
MAASVLNTTRAIQVSLYVIRAFVRLREVLATHKALAGKLADLERKVAAHDQHIRSLFEAIHQLMTPTEPNKRKIGFVVKGKICELWATQSLVRSRKKSVIRRLISTF